MAMARSTPSSTWRTTPTSSMPASMPSRITTRLAGAGGAIRTSCSTPRVISPPPRRRRRRRQSARALSPDRLEGGRDPSAMFDFRATCSTIPAAAAGSIRSRIISPSSAVSLQAVGPISPVSTRILPVPQSGRRGRRSTRSLTSRPRLARGRDPNSWFGTSAYLSKYADASQPAYEPARALPDVPDGRKAACVGPLPYRRALAADRMWLPRRQSARAFPAVRLLREPHGADYGLGAEARSGFRRHLSASRGGAFGWDGGRLASPPSAL